MNFRDLCAKPMFVALILLGSVAIHAQTTVISVPAASVAGIKYTLPERFGINLEDSFNYGNNQLTANLLASDAVSFTPQTWQASSACRSGTTTSWTDANGYSPQPANFWRGATYRVISGVNAGATGTVTSSTGATGAAGVTFHLSGTLTAGCSGSGGGDEMIVRCPTAQGTCAGGYNPSQLAGIKAGGTGGGTVTFETTDLSPSSSSPQALQLNAAGLATAGVDAVWDGLLNSKSYINLNGTYTLSFRYKCTSGIPTLSYRVYRVGGPPFLNGSLPALTCNGTPGAGWTNASYSFAASETGAQTSTGQAWLEATDGTVVIQDIELTESPTAGNTTVFRNAVYQKLLALKPGILRMMTIDSWGCTPDNMMQSAYSGRSLCGNNSYFRYGQPISYGWSDFMTLAAAVGADPWITFSAYATPTDMANIAAYMSGTCGNGNVYTAMRCEYGQIAPWTQVFRRIYLEMGNEAWNSGNSEILYGGFGTAYGRIFGPNAAAFKASSFYNSKMKLVANGFILSTSGPYSWNNTVLSAAAGTTGGLPDYIDGAPYMFFDMTDLSSTQNIFGPMFAEPANFASVPTYGTGTGYTYALQNYTHTNFPTVNGAVYESNLATNCAITGTTQAQINQVVSGVGSGLDATLNLLLSARDSGVLVQNFFALPEVENQFGLSASATSGSCPPINTYNPYQPLWGSNLLMPGPGSTGTIDRPSGIMLQGINNAIGSKLHLLATTQSGTPTYSQPAAQPNPTAYPKPGTDSIAANPAVPYVQAFGFGDGLGNYALIVYNLNWAASEAIKFSGAGAPTGTVTKTVFTSANITDNNEGASIGSSPTVTYPPSSTLTNASGDTLAPFSMVTYTWGTKGRLQ